MTTSYQHVLLRFKQTHANLVIGRNLFNYAMTVNEFSLFQMSRDLLPCLFEYIKILETREVEAERKVVNLKDTVRRAIMGVQNGPAAGKDWRQLLEKMLWATLEETE